MCVSSVVCLSRSNEGHAVSIHTHESLVFIPFLPLHVTNQFKSLVPFNYLFKKQFASDDQLIETDTGARICTFLLSTPSASVTSVGWNSKYSL